MTDEPCKQENLEAVTNTREYWTADDNGEPLDHVRFGDSDVEEYYCPGCYEFFDTWDEALEHLKVKEAA